MRDPMDPTVGDGKTGAEVIRQSRNDSWWNKDPLLMKAAVVGVTGSICLALGAFGIVSEEQRLTIIETIGNITYGVFTLLPLFFAIVTALWARLSVFSPRTAAKIAVANAAAPSGAAPTLLSPP